MISPLLSRSGSRAVLAAVVIALCSILPGCGNANYRGADLTARSFNEDPRGLGDTYVGFDLSFALESEAPHVPPRPSPAAATGLTPQADVR